jgi:hypothetical protein
MGLNVTYNKHMNDRKDATKAAREGFLATLRNLKVETLTAQYSGSCDSGNVDGIAVEPEQGLTADLEMKLQDFIWDVAYNAHPGFENNDGGEGTVSWNIAADSITIEHGTNVVDIEWSTLEDL